MERIALGNGRWFDKDKSKEYEEGTDFDGRNEISMATGDRFLHQSLFKTVGGSWVLMKWSQWAGQQTTYELVTDEEAQKWLIQNGYFDDVDEETLKSTEV